MGTDSLIALNGETMAAAALVMCASQPGVYFAMHPLAVLTDIQGALGASPMVNQILSAPALRLQQGTNTAYKATSQAEMHALGSHLKACRIVSNVRDLF